MKRTITILISLLCLSLCLQLNVGAQDVPAVQEYICTLEPIAEPEELLEGFLYGQAGASFFSGSTMESRLTGVNKALYLAARDMAEQIAAGQLDTASVSIDSSDVFPESTGWTAEELGVEKLGTTEAVLAYYEAIDFDLGLVADAVRADCPYEMYWCGLRCSASVYTYRWDYTIGQYLMVPPEKLTITFEVVEAYRDAAASPSQIGLYYIVDTSKTTAAAGALQNANTILSRWAGETDAAKLRGYADALCELNTYNHNAAAGNEGEYGDPWQIIYMFDGDPNTNVVCEGYSKAFLYLCQRTAFISDIEAFTVSGLCGTTALNGGPHMWNTVYMDDGRTYLVDVTNLDASWPLFLAIASDGDYRETLAVGGLYYSYDNDTFALYSGDYAKKALKLSRLAYGKVDCGNNHKPQTISGTAPTCTETGLTDGSVCYACEKILTAQESIPATGHTEVIDPAQAAGCTAAGKTEGKHCSVCRKVLIEPQVIPAKGHIVVVDPEVPVSGTEPGLTEGSHCSECGEILVAQTTVMPTYQISYDASGGKNAPAAQSVEIGDSLTLSTALPSRTGYSFLGWAASADAAAAEYQPGDAVTPTDNTTLYALWKANTYTIKFNANGGTGTMASRTGLKYDSDYTLTANAFKYTGKSFAGWNTKSDGSGTQYADKASVKNLTGTNGKTVTLYARWKTATYAVTFDANGGSGAPDAQKKTYNKTLTLSSAKPTRKGYTFQSWNTKADGSGTAYKPGASYTKNAKVTLYAQWKVNTYTIKFSANGGTGTMSSLTGRKYGKTYTLTANAFKRTGYSFTGWNTKADGSGTAYADKASVKSLSSKNGATVTMYAQWKKLTYKVTYDANGGTGAPDAQKKTYNKDLTLSSVKPTREGYSFQGWATSASSATVAYKAGATYTKNAKVTLYAVWKKK